MTIGEKITQRRLAAHLSQEILAERLGVSTQDVSRWESGEVLPDAEKLLQLCRVFGISANEITIASRSRLATGGRCRVFFRGSMAVMLPQPGSVGSNRHRSPTSRVVASLRKMPRPRHSVFVPSSLMTV